MNSLIRNLYLKFNRFLKEIKWLFFKIFLYKPNVLSEVETIELIKKQSLSVSRFGDGEYRIMIEKGEIGFQKFDILLKQKLIEAFNCRNDKLLICSFDFSKRRPMKNKAGLWLKTFVCQRYKYIKRLFDKRYIYGNAEITRFYNPAFYYETDFNYLENEYVPKLKTIWENQDILIVEGSETKLGVGNDLFDNVKSITRIVCPPVNAFNSYNSILKNVRESYDDRLVLVALGPTASVLTYELCSKYNIRAIDIGHVDIVYLWMLNRSRTPDKVSGKYVNESNNNSLIIPIESFEDEYDKQIIKRIDC